MKIYQVEKDVDRYESLILKDVEADWEIIYRFDGTPLATSWHPLELRICRDPDDERKYLKGDFPHTVGFGPALVLSDRALGILAPLLQDNGELLPIKYPRGNYVLFNATCLADVLNFEQSDIVYFPTGRIMTIRRYVFDAEKIPSNDVFKIAQMPLLGVFVTERFKLAVEENDLEGLLFKPVEVVR